MIFSVFDHNARCFDYYEAPGTSANYGARGTKYRPLTQGPQGPLAASMGLAGTPGDRVCVGFSPESLAMLLPANARPVGRGDQAKGIVAVVSRSQSRSVSTAGYDSVAGFGGLGSFDGLGVVAAIGSELGEDAPVPTSVAGETSFGRIIAAACVASVVGVVVQKLLKKW